MTVNKHAKALGKRGGEKRAKRLSSEQKKVIASLGGKARAESLQAAKRIEENFLYLETIQELRESNE